MAQITHDKGAITFIATTAAVHSERDTDTRNPSILWSRPGQRWWWWRWRCSAFTGRANRDGERGNDINSLAVAVVVVASAPAGTIAWHRPFVVDGGYGQLAK